MDWLTISGTLHIASITNIINIGIPGKMIQAIIAVRRHGMNASMFSIHFFICALRYWNISMACQAEFKIKNIHYEKADP